MRNATFMFVCSIFCVIFLSVITQAQTSLIHDTGPVQMEVIDNGYIGDDGTGTFSGFVFNGNVNAMFTAGLIDGQVAGGVYDGAGGMIGSFVDGGGTPVIQDYSNVTPFSGFSSDPSFNQISAADITHNLIPGADAHIEYKSNTGQNFVFLSTVLTNNTPVDLTQVYLGIFADWDVGGANYLLNRGGYDPQRNMLYQYENGGAVDPNYYGILLVNEVQNPVRGTVDKDIVFTTLEQLRLDIFDLMTSTDFIPITTDGDYRTYLCTGPHFIPIGESLTIDYAFVAGTSLSDLQANADSAMLYIPVELTSFTAVSQSGKVILNWSTATELNNLGFEIERKLDNSDWDRIGFVAGHGTTTEPKEYSYSDDIKNITVNSLAYRLKQIDFDGSYEYSDEVLVEVEIPLPSEFTLHQNYPNPFNPVTIISYSLPIKSQVEIVIYNTLGESITRLVNGEKEAGQHSVEFNAASLPSGIYFYKLQAESFAESKKMLLLK